MKKLYTICLAILGLTTQLAFAGDTTTVRVHDQVDVTWYGEKAVWGNFPDGSKTYRQILMRYTLGCASTGCSDWDYTTRIDLKHNTGAIDTNITSNPTFTVDGDIVDSNYISTDTTFATRFNASTKETDTFANPAYQYIYFNDAENPTTPADTSYFWPANYYTYTYDTTGQIIDSALVPFDQLTIIDYHRDSTFSPVLEPYEMGRVITPYGGYMRTNQQGFSNNWSHTYVFDVTDFALMLKDSVLIGAFYEGWSSGFSVTLDFDFIEGTPARNTLSIQNIYNGGYTHSNPTDFEQNKWAPTKRRIHADAVTAAIKTTITGHGFDNSTSCAEFCPKDFSLYVDLQKRFDATIWNDQCGENPVYPQAGTWIYDRANWCPGGKGTIQEFEITPFITPNKNTWFDMNLEGFNWTGAQAPSYNTDAILFCYGALNHSVDVSMSRIIAPNNDKEYNRINPICGGNPVIEVQNLGATKLTTVTINYGVKGGAQKTFNWAGDLDFNEKAVVDLPALNFPEDWTGTADVFEVSLSNPNGSADENVDNDKMATEFSKVPEYVNNFVVQFRTNNRGAENAWEILDMAGNVKFSNGTFSSSTTYRDTVYLPYGCYAFRVYDTQEDGLVFPNDPNAGSGSVKFIRATGPGNVATFNANFGSSITHFFSVTDNVGIEENFSNLIEVYPNPSTGIVNVSLSMLKDEATQLILVDLLGKVVYQERHAHLQQADLNLDLNHLPNGIYTLQVKTASQLSTTKIVLKH